MKKSNKTKKRVVKKSKQPITKNQFPEYSEESINAANFIGLDFPYVPGDPGL